MDNNENFRNEINKAVFEKGLDKISYSDILVSLNTPEILLKIGFENLPILFSKKHFYKSIKPYNRKKHYKGLDLYKHIYKIPDILEDPSIIIKDIIIDSDTGKIINDIKHSGDILICSSLLDDNNFPIVLSLKANAEKGIYNDIIKENYIITIFGHDNFKSLLEIAIKNDFVYFYSNKKVQELNQFTEKLVPHALFNLGTNVILHKINENVNLMQNNNEKEEFFGPFKTMKALKESLDS